MSGNRKQVSFVDRSISAFKNRNDVENPIEMTEMSEYFLPVFFPTKIQTFGCIFFFFLNHFSEYSDLAFIVIISSAFLT